MFATVRNRRGIVAAVEPFDGPEGRIQLVHLEYKDDQLPAQERLLWEIEAHRVLLEPTALPQLSRDTQICAVGGHLLLRTPWFRVS